MKAVFILITVFNVVLFGLFAFYYARHTLNLVFTHSTLDETDISYYDDTFNQTNRYNFYWWIYALDGLWMIVPFFSYLVILIALTMQYNIAFFPQWTFVAFALIETFKFIWRVIQMSFCEDFQFCRNEDAAECTPASCSPNIQMQISTWYSILLIILFLLESFIISLINGGQEQVWNDWRKWADRKKRFAAFQDEGPSTLEKLLKKTIPNKMMTLVITVLIVNIIVLIVNLVYFTHVFQNLVFTHNFLSAGDVSYYVSGLTTGRYDWEWWIFATDTIRTIYPTLLFFAIIAVMLYGPIWILYTQIFLVFLIVLEWVKLLWRSFQYMFCEDFQFCRNLVDTSCTATSCTPNFDFHLIIYFGLFYAIILIFYSITLLTLDSARRNFASRLIKGNFSNYGVLKGYDLKEEMGKDTSEDMGEEPSVFDTQKKFRKNINKRF